MMPQFHAGQDVEVDVAGQSKQPAAQAPEWNKATIIGREIDHDEDGVSFFGDGYEVQFPDGTRSMFDTEHIRKVVHLPHIKAGEAVLVEGLAVVYKR